MRSSNKRCHPNLEVSSFQIGVRERKKGNTALSWHKRKLNSRFHFLLANSCTSKYATQVLKFSTIPSSLFQKKSITYLQKGKKTGCLLQVTRYFRAMGNCKFGRQSVTFVCESRLVPVCGKENFCCESGVRPFSHAAMVTTTTTTTASLSGQKYSGFRIYRHLIYRKFGYNDSLLKVQTANLLYKMTRDIRILWI